MIVIADLTKATDMYRAMREAEHRAYLLHDELGVELYRLSKSLGHGSQKVMAESMGIRSDMMTRLVQHGRRVLERGW